MIFTLKPIFFDRVGLSFYGYEKHKIINSHVGATLKYKIIDGSSISIKFIDHDSLLYLRFWGDLSGTLGPEKCIFEIRVAASMINQNLVRWVDEREVFVLFQ